MEEVTETVMGEAAAAGEVAAMVAVAEVVQGVQGVQEVQEAPWEGLEEWEAPDPRDLTATVPGTGPARVAATAMETATVAEGVAATAGAARAVLEALVALEALWVEWEARDLQDLTATVCGTGPVLVMETATAMVAATATEVAAVTADAARAGQEGLEGLVDQSEVWVEWEAPDPRDLTATVCGTGRELARGRRPDRAGGAGESRGTRGRRTSRVEAEAPGSTLWSRKCSTLIQRTRCSQYPRRSQAREFRESSPRDSRVMTLYPHLEMAARVGVAAVTVEAAVTVAGAVTVLQVMEVALVVGLKDPPDPLALEEVMAGADEARVARGDLEDLAGA